jgi:hypothetical protein
MGVRRLIALGQARHLYVCSLTKQPKSWSAFRARPVLAEVDVRRHGDVFHIADEARESGELRH